MSKSAPCPGIALPMHLQCLGDKPKVEALMQKREDRLTQSGCFKDLVISHLWASFWVEKA
jgi:hypothetical protein